jgi:CheY-like chemotaxis protein
MPAMTGETLVRELRRVDPDMSLILCTGSSPLIDAERAAAVGIDAFLLQPVEPQTLAHTIRQVWHSARERKPEPSSLLCVVPEYS